MHKHILEKIISEAAFERLARAVEAGRLMMTIIVSPEVTERLCRDEIALLELADGGVVLMIPQSIIEELYNDHPKI